MPELLLGQKYGHAIHFWDLEAGKHFQCVDLGAQHQMALELRPSHDPEATWGFVGVVISTDDLSGSVWRWFHDGDDWKAEKVITIPADRRTWPAAAGAEALRCGDTAYHRHRPLSRRQVLYVSCWGTGERNSSTCRTGEPEAGGVRAARRHRQPDPAPGQGRYAALRRSQMVEMP